eukprot:scaffold47_cov258-Pinguiococcus_pyrenoidosus.AAC.11
MEWMRQFLCVQSCSQKTLTFCKLALGVQILLALHLPHRGEVQHGVAETRGRERRQAGRRGGLLQHDIARHLVNLAQYPGDAAELLLIPALRLKGRTALQQHAGNRRERVGRPGVVVVQRAMRLERWHPTQQLLDIRIRLAPTHRHDDVVRIGGGAVEQLDAALQVVRITGGVPLQAEMREEGVRQFPFLEVGPERRDLADS